MERGVPAAWWNASTAWPDHQGRHRKMMQGLLDLKRLYWNLHQFRAGHRKNQTPYGLLGLKLPALSFWEFLRMTPEESRKQLSATDDVP